MKLKLSQIKNFLNAYQTVSKQPLDIKLAYRLSKMKINMQEDGNFFDTQMSDIIEKYAEKDESGKPVYIGQSNSIRIQEGKLNECQEEINKLNNLEVEIKDFQPITLEDLKYFHLSASEMEGLLPFIAEETTE